MLISFSLILENLVDYLLKESKLPQVCWENGRKEDLMHIPFDGVPFVLLSAMNINVIKEKIKKFQKKMKYREDQRQKLCSDHPQHKLSLPNYLNQPKHLIAQSGFKLKKFTDF